MNNQQPVSEKDLTPRWDCPDCGAWGHSTAKLGDATHPRWAHHRPDGANCRVAGLHGMAAWARQSAERPSMAASKAVLSSLAMNCDILVMDLQRERSA